jgi:hypothetical protein
MRERIRALNTKFRFVPLVGGMFDFTIDIDSRGEGKSEDYKTIVQRFKDTEDALAQLEDWRKQILREQDDE